MGDATPKTASKGHAEKSTRHYEEFMAKVSSSSYRQQTTIGGKMGDDSQEELR